MMKKLIWVLILGLMLAPSFVTKGQGCMEPASSDGVTIFGYIQPQYNYTFYGDADKGKTWDDGIDKASNTFLFNRARLGVTGKVPYNFSYYALAEFSSFRGGPYMLDFFVSYHGLGPWAKISVG